MGENWYFDDNLWESFYPIMFAEEHFALAAEQVAILPQLLGREPNNVLDMASGPGRHSLPLAKAGYSVTAVDSSQFLLDHLRAHSQEEQLDITIIQADMREFKDPEAYDLVLNLWTSFGYFDDPADDIRVLENAFESLQEGGQMILDVVGKEYLCRNIEPVVAREFEDGRILIEQPELTRNLSRMENRWTLVSGDQVVSTEFQHNCYSATELEDRLFAAGFSSVSIMGGFAGEPYDLDAERLVLIAGK